MKLGTSGKGDFFIIIFYFLFFFKFTLPEVVGAAAGELAWKAAASGAGSLWAAVHLTELSNDLLQSPGLRSLFILSWLGWALRVCFVGSSQERCSGALMRAVLCAQVSGLRLDSRGERVCLPDSHFVSCHLGGEELTAARTAG